MTFKTLLAAANHRLFLLTVLAKAVLGLIQIAIAAATYLDVLQQMPRLAQWLVRKELSEDPSDFVATHLLSLANILPASNETFFAVYFGAHGLLHVIIVAALLWGAEWAYHVAVIVLSGFVVYQMLEWASIGGTMLLILSVIDLAVIYLTIREARTRKT